MSGRVTVIGPPNSIYWQKTRTTLALDQRMLQTRSIMSILKCFAELGLHHHLRHLLGVAHDAREAHSCVGAREHEVAHAVLYGGLFHVQHN